MSDPEHASWASPPLLTPFVSFMILISDRGKLQGGPGDLDDRPGATGSPFHSHLVL